MAARSSRLARRAQLRRALCGAGAAPAADRCPPGARAPTRPLASGATYAPALDRARLRAQNRSRRALAGGVGGRSRAPRPRPDAPPDLAGDLRGVAPRRPRADRSRALPVLRPSPGRVRRADARFPVAERKVFAPPGDAREAA